MIFSSLTYYIFFTVVLLLLLLTQLPPIAAKLNFRKNKVRHIILLAASYIFYGWWDYRFCFLMILLTVISWLCAKNIAKNRFVKLNIYIGIIFPLIILGFFKYFNFFIDSFCTIFSIKNSFSLNIILPVGISFYTFQSMSYTIDVYRKKVPASSLLKVALYIAFFPQLVAGPIVKSNEFIPQLDEEKEIKIKNLLSGVQIFAFGLFKKIVLADNLSIFVDDVFSRVNAFHSFSVILAVIAYSMQIYFDFSGYSDMAIGSAKCLGYTFERNFNLPYISKNVSEFWKRWHISLSSWLQQYLYIPLGGNRKSMTRTYINLMITMVLGGLWHGASINFIIWGFLHGAALCIHKLFRKLVPPSESGGRITNKLSILMTYIFVCICWAFFRAENVETAFDIIRKMFVWSDGIIQPFIWVFISLILLIGATAAAVLRSSGQDKINGFYINLDLTKIFPLTVFFIFIGLIFALCYTGSNPFIYFQF